MIITLMYYNYYYYHHNYDYCCFDVYNFFFICSRSACCSSYKLAGFVDACSSTVSFQSLLLMGSPLLPSSIRVRCKPSQKSSPSSIKCSQRSFHIYIFDVSAHTLLNALSDRRCLHFQFVCARRLCPKSF